MVDVLPSSRFRDGGKPCHLNTPSSNFPHHTTPFWDPSTILRIQSTDSARPYGQSTILVDEEKGHHYRHLKDGAAQKTSFGARGPSRPVSSWLLSTVGPLGRLSFRLALLSLHLPTTSPRPVRDLFLSYTHFHTNLPPAEVNHRLSPGSSASLSLPVHLVFSSAVCSLILSSVDSAVVVTAIRHSYQFF
ncbi:hypothetical protein Cob_v000553 [Colletotrichum orbiculare MAFF 240422]|uniref:Uncharacterized protein n=1 Tax=Colletotrichum orbiculare (strain 104-T / ATCC 96160 / CBS 514.97 / LARS 414 / MAFF 240422) TaxID=1213857 RepID=A0A484GB64_COLOR|nr:hypothetical protein Cob_v000553 [Colletotrichum orbiculare MAFF 240422]